MTIIHAMSCDTDYAHLCIKCHLPILLSCFMALLDEFTDQKQAPRCQESVVIIEQT